MSKFTPGPWRIAGGTYSERWVVDSESPKVGKQNLIAMLQNHWKGNVRGDMDANAALIAAAPAMYEALQKCAEFASKTGSEPEVLVVILQQIAKISQAALHAADGGKP